MNCVERVFQVNDLDLHALHWRPQNTAQQKPRWICSHGWLDNAGSFLRVAEALWEQGHELVAIDMAGCGLSQHRSLHGGYNLWDDILDIQAIIEALEWKNFSLMGHSRGAMISALYASTRPEGLQRLALIDGVLPPFKETDPFAEQLRDFLAMRKELIQKNQRLESLLNNQTSSTISGLSMKGAWQQRYKNCELDYEDMLPLLQRGLKKVSDGYLWGHDNRLKGRSVYRLSERDQLDILERLDGEGLLIIAKEGRLFEHLKFFEQSLPSFKVRALEGSHHLHMQAENYQQIVNEIVTFTENH